MTIRVLVADDQDLVRTGLALILGTLRASRSSARRATGRRPSGWPASSVPMSA